MGKLKGILKENDVVIKNMASYIDVTPETITSWDKKKTHPSITQFKKMADYLNVSLNYLIKRVYD